MSRRCATWYSAALGLAGSLALGACGGDGSDAPDARDAVSAGGSAPSTSGTLTLGEGTFDFRVLSCDLSDAEAESHDELLRGTGTTEDGTRLTVVVDRGMVGGFPTHSVSLHYGNVMDGSGFIGEGRRIQGPTGWTQVGGDPRNRNEPFVVIDGRTVRAEGTFQVDDAGEESEVEGHLEATCPG